MTERKSVCFPRWGTQDVTTFGDDDFKQELNRWYSGAESEALEALVELKARLRTLSTDDFLAAVVEGLSKVVGSEMAFVMKRLLVDDQDTAVEMPPFGEPGSCLMAAALHYRASDGEKHTIKQNKFHAYACPCAYMRHDKIFLIPEELAGFITNNPNTIPIEVDSYMAIPLFAEGKCIAHFGVMWSKESSPSRRYPWAFVESLMHALEDMIAQRIVEGANFLKPALTTPEEPQASRVIPHEVVSVAQSLRPYAGSLSHELRTPMQGVVGMLDVMYATVQEAVRSQDDPHLGRVFQNLKESIEVVQDSSRRAVVAADNVVHAYDMNMSIPETISPMQEIANPLISLTMSHKQPDIVVAGQEIPFARSAPKRRRDADSEQEDKPNSPGKAAKLDATAAATAGAGIATPTLTSEASQEIKAGLQEAHNVHLDDKDLRRISREPRSRDSSDSTGSWSSPTLQATHIIRRSANVRAVLQYVINEGLKTGGRPDSVTAIPTDNGEIIEVRSRSSDGTISQKHITWSVDEALPTTLNYDEKDFSKLISCIVLNAIKFTDGLDGRVNVHAQLCPRGRYVVITISDNGRGMPAAFLPKLFKPFSQENSSLTRQSEGLGLGLMVAKGISRKLGGDLMCTRAETESPNNGCEFEIKLPMSPGDVISRSSSPLSSPLPQHRAVEKIPVSADLERIPDPPRLNSDLAVLRLNKSVLDREEKPTSDASQASAMPDGQSNSSRPHLSRLHRSNGIMKTTTSFEVDRELALKYPLTFLIAEDNKINRKLLVSMLSKFGYSNIFEAHDGVEAVRQMSVQAANNASIDVVLMDLWMPLMDGYEATQRILSLDWKGSRAGPTILAVTADVTDGALERAALVGMKGFMTKPYKLQDLQRLITEYCDRRMHDDSAVGETHPAAMTQMVIMA